MIITIDGPAGSGKGTIAAALAKKYKKDTIFTKIKKFILSFVKKDK